LNFTEESVSTTIQNRIVSDQELVLRLQRGDEWAFQLLVRRFRKKLFSIAFGITLDAEESKDIVQEVFLQVYRRIHTFRGDASLATWLHRITVNRCLNWKRRWSRRFRWMHVPFSGDDDDAAQEPASPLPTPEDSLVDAQTSRDIDRALKQLPDQARVVFVLREIEGLSYEEIAEVTGIKLGTVRSRLFNARKRLKEILEPPGETT
jgi:RNA polymerase sigma-70 factor (ECF subfamily)